VTVRIAERWFDIKHIDDGVTLLWEPHLHPVWQSNIWHVRGRDQDLLIDTGMGVGNLAEAIQELTDRLIVAVATHRHADHIGGLHQFETRYAHPADAEDIGNPVGLASLITSDFPQGFVQMMEEAGTPAGPELIDAYPRQDYDPREYRVHPAPLSRLLDEGDVIDMGARAFTVLHLPGHTPGSIGLWDERAGVLFSGDAIYDGPLYDFLPESSIPDYVQTMRRLRELPVTTVHGGHDPSFGRERLIEIADDYLARRDQPTRAHTA
jgi:glyoxylase-like metal-dependent hydrolase (beta-lactamase superfamily II)